MAATKIVFNPLTGNFDLINVVVDPADAEAFSFFMGG